MNDFEPSMPLEDGDVFAIMLYTDQNQDLYRDIKTSLTGKEKPRSSVMGAMYNLNIIQKQKNMGEMAP